MTESSASEIPGNTRPCRKSRSSRPLREMVVESLNRRTFLHVAMAGTSSAVLTATGRAASAPAFQFRSVAPSAGDAVVVPDGYTAEVLYRWGDPVNGQTPQFRPDASNTAEDQARQAGMGHDGMELFSVPGHDPDTRGLLVINHEYTDQVLLFSDGLGPLPPALMPPEKVRKSKASHGVSVIEIARMPGGDWMVVDSARARRITADTPMRISGPAVSVLGDSVRGTVNNCATGRTPWGTCLTCEENFQGVFGTSHPGYVPTSAQRRYGLRPEGYCYTVNGRKVGAYRWWEQDERFDLASSTNDSERFGYVVEIDPRDPESTPVKRTALGRLKHENAELVLSADGRVVVYLGDDEADEFIYKFVSVHRWDPSAASASDPGNAGSLLDEGTLYVARFEDDGAGQWLALVPGQNGIPVRRTPDDDDGFDAADICIRTRQAATIAGATPMDRPEWVAVHPETREVFVSLTNNRGRQTTDSANPRARNIFGHILRWHETDNDPASESFRWRIFVLAGNPSHPNEECHGNIVGDSFGCPDGLKFDSAGILWIQTDMSSSVVGTSGYAELGNNMMLAADPVSGEIRRFLVGPRGCEITGNAMTPDRRTMFVNIQHPGEPPDDVSDPTDPGRYSTWPDGAGSRPRSATIAIRRQDGGVIGS